MGKEGLGSWRAISWHILEVCHQNLILGLDVVPCKGSKGHEELEVYTELWNNCQFNICLELDTLIRSVEMPEGYTILTLTKLVLKFSLVAG